MYDICILTTAIIRPKIHILSMNSLKKILKSETKIYWIINIDFVNTNPKYIKTENLSENYVTDCLNYTEENFKNIFKNFKNIEFKFIKNVKGNFNIAVRTLLNNCIDVIEKIKYGVLYLEDDWLVTKNIACINDNVVPSSGANGKLKQYALELSNVDLTSQFASMISHQRSFQAGSRVVTTSDMILTEAVNLKR